MDTLKTLNSPYFSNHAEIMFCGKKTLELLAKYSDKKMGYFKRLWADFKECKRHKRDTHKHYGRMLQYPIDFKEHR